MLARSLVIVTAVILASLPCFAQEGGEITLQFLSFPKSVAPEPVELLVGEGKTIEVEIPTNALSAEYRVKRPERWVFGKSSVDEEGKESFDIYGQAAVPSSQKQIILLVRQGKGNADGMEIIPIENNADNFGGGIFLFMNATKVDIAGTIGDKKFALAPGKIANVKPQAKAADRNEGTVHTKLFFRTETEAKPFFSSTWPLNDKARNFVFFYHDPYSKRLRLHTIRDFLP